MKILSLAALLLLFGAVLICIRPIVAEGCIAGQCAKCPEIVGKKLGCYCKKVPGVVGNLFTSCQCLPCDKAIPTDFVGCHQDHKCQSNAAKECKHGDCAKCPDKERKKEGCYCFKSDPVFQSIWKDCRCLPCESISTIPKILNGCSLDHKCQSVGDGQPQPPSEIYYGDAYPANVTL